MAGRERATRAKGAPSVVTRHTPAKVRRTARAAPRALVQVGPGGAWLADFQRGANPALPARGGGGVPLVAKNALYPAVAGRSVDEQFRELSARWREETEHLSSTDVFTHPDYQRIIGLGTRAVPLLLRDLSATGAHWFWALRAITGENPVRAEDAGNVRKMREAWLAWGEARGMV